MSPVGPRRSSWPSVMPRMPVHVVGVSRDHMPVSETTTTSQREPVAPLLEQRGEVRRARLLLALHDQLEVDGRAGAPGRLQVRADAEGVEEDLALVVGGAARVAAGRRPRRLERRVLPQLERRDRLHVVVAVDDDGRRGFVVARPLGEDGGQPGGLPDLDGRESGVAQGLREPLGRAPHVAGVGRVAGDGRDAQPLDELGDEALGTGLDGLADLGGLRRIALGPGLIRRTLRARPMPGHRDRGLASGRCASPPSTCCTAGR